MNNQDEVKKIDTKHLRIRKFGDMKPNTPDIFLNEIQKDITTIINRIYSSNSLIR